MLFSISNDTNHNNFNGCQRHHNTNNVMRKTVKAIRSAGDFESQYGHFYKWMIDFEDGMQAEYLSKTETQNKFIEGQEIDVDVTTREYNGKTINKVKPASTFQPTARQTPQRNEKTQELIVKQNALTNACNVIGTADVAQIIEVAEVFANWVLNDEKPTKSNDLPF